MSSRYKQMSQITSDLFFSEAPFSNPEFSALDSDFDILTSFNGGELVPILCMEVLPNSVFELNLDMVIRQSSITSPTFGSLSITVDAFFVPNRIVNFSFENVVGKNSAGEFTATDISLAPLYANTSNTVKINPGSVADYYGFATQYPISGALLNKCHDLMFRGYVEIYNNFYRDQNFQKPIPYSKLNVYNGFLESVGTQINMLESTSIGASVSFSSGLASDGSFARGALIKAIFGEGFDGSFGDNVVSGTLTVPSRKTLFSANGPCLSANKFHDYFTSVLPKPQKGNSVQLNFSDGAVLPVIFGVDTVSQPFVNYMGGQAALRFSTATRPSASGYMPLLFNNSSSIGEIGIATQPQSVTANSFINGWNVTGEVDLSQANAGISIDELRASAALQQFYEALARGGTRYEEYLHAMFGLEIDDKLKNIPSHIGRITRSLDLYQTAQTSASQENSPQGNLAAFGYTNTQGRFPRYKAFEHGYIHVIACIRQRNLYPSYFNKSYTRTKSEDYYHKEFANLSEQPVYTFEYNPFASLLDAYGNARVFGYQEAWADYRYEPSRVSGKMRAGLTGSTSYWTYQDKVNSGSGTISAGNLFIKSNAREVIDETLAVKSTVDDQFRAMFRFKTTKILPMPVHSVPGMDII